MNLKIFPGYTHIIVSEILQIYIRSIKQFTMCENQVMPSFPSFRVYRFVCAWIFCEFICFCVYVFVCICFFVCLSVYISVHVCYVISIYSLVWVSLCMCIFKFMYICVQILLFLCAWEPVNIYTLTKNLNRNIITARIVLMSLNRRKLFFFCFSISIESSVFEFFTRGILYFPLKISET